MNFAFIYLAHRFFFRLTDFFHHWYVDASRYLVHWFISFLERLDRFFAVRITFAHLFEPLWNDHTIIGHIMGFLFRTSRVLAGSVVYFFCGVAFAAIFIAWVLLPFVLLVLVYRNMGKPMI